MSTTWRPTVVPGDFTPAQAQWINAELTRLYQSLEGVKPYERYVYTHVAPEKVNAGDFYLADGSDWNPGSGAGLYRRSEDNTSWVFIG